MRYIIKLIPLVCGECGFSPATCKIGITSLGELALMWDCRCGNQIIMRINLERLIAMIPNPPIAEIGEGWTDADRELMAKAHIDLGGV